MRVILVILIASITLAAQTEPAQSTSAPQQQPQASQAQTHGQPPADSASGSAQGPAASVGLFVYPKNQQTAAQQQADEATCYQWAKEQTGIDPAATVATNQQQEANSPKGGGAKGAAKGAAGGAAIGAIAGDAGTGAGAGAVAGTVAGRRKQKKAKKEAEKQAQEQQKEQVAQTQDTFKKAMGTCLDGHGYSVK